MHIPADATVIDQPEAGAKRDAATQQAPRTDLPAQKFHRFMHHCAPGFAGRRGQAHGKQKIEFDQLIPPLFEHDVEHAAQVVAYRAVVKVEGMIPAAPQRVPTDAQRAAPRIF